MKNETGVARSKFAKKVDAANFKSNIDKFDTDKLGDAPTNVSNLKSSLDKLDVHKLALFPADSSKLNDVVKNDVVKSMYIVLRSK